MFLFIKNRSRHGFTLIELLVVISIIGLLSSVVLAALSSARMKARDVRRMQDMKQIQTALEMYRNDEGHYPYSTSVTGGAQCGDDWCESKDSTQWGNLATLLNKYISTLPKDPLSTGTGSAFADDDSYHYAYKSGTSGTICGDGSCYDLVAKFEDPNNPYRCEIKKYMRFYNKTAWDCSDSTPTHSKRLYSPQN